MRSLSEMMSGRCQHCGGQLLRELQADGERITKCLQCGREHGLELRVGMHLPQAKRLGPRHAMMMDTRRPHGRLTWSKVLEIRARVKDAKATGHSLSLRVLAQQYGVCETTIQDVVAERSWRSATHTENPWAKKLDWDKVRAIRAQWALRDATGATRKSLARQYGIDRRTVGQVVNYRVWIEDAERFPQPDGA